MKQSLKSKSPIMKRLAGHFQGRGANTMEPIKRIAQHGTMIVLAHLIALLGHAVAHWRLHVVTNWWQSLYTAVVIFGLPLLAMLLLWTRAQRAGLVLLGLTLAAAMIFGVCYHFVLSSEESIFLHRNAWGTLFTTTAALLAIVEGV